MIIQDPQFRITHHFSDGLYAKESFFKAGMSILKHTHNFSHLSILAMGKVVEAPACIEIKAGLTHGVKAITDCVWFCIHATDETDPSKVDEILIKGD